MTRPVRMLRSSEWLGIPSKVRPSTISSLLGIHPHRVVSRLEYQAYSKMTVKTMTDIFLSAHPNPTRSEHAVSSTSPASPLLHCAVHHRLGVMPVGEASVVIAISSPHRKEVSVACECLLEQAKLNVLIWKQEVDIADKQQSPGLRSSARI
ncbi:hypothetical protein BDM02DRAFT_822962 [Thelephora ganbajun]|uniref:Uncharacterized protein n=1 Tax=Thelephora ganbajun TaxID=370292 RepID=A0ACB6Z6G4_THEGA|nr:hypothetical protein BDM02DRAFT_822962 [Thelephora ganbajun]